MAKELNMQFSGRIGPLVGCLRDGNYYYRSRPDKMKQSSGTKRSAGIFGQAASLGRMMRVQLAASIPNPKDANMRRRLEGRIRKWLALSGGLPPQVMETIPFLKNFNFNAENSLAERLRINPVMEVSSGGQVLLQLPAFVPNKKVTAPKGTTHLEICVSAMSLRPGSNFCEGSSSRVMELAYDEVEQPAQSIDLQLPSGQGYLLLAVVQLRFNKNLEPGTNIRKQVGNPVAAIVGASYS